MSGRHLKKYFGKEKFTVTHPKLQEKTKKFLAKELEVDPKEVVFDAKGRILLGRRALENAQKSPLDDTSFLTDGGKGAAIYEGVEMAYNDVMAGTVQAGGTSFTGRMRETFRKGVALLPEPIKETGRALRESGALEILTGVGVGATVGLGIWLARSGIKQASQGLARGDVDQTLNGSRHVFMGGESLLTGAALASELGSHTVLKAAGQVAKGLAAPFAIANGVIDVVQGANHIKDGIKNKDGWAGAEGIAELGMGIGWVAAAFGATPAIVAVSCACLAAKIGVVAVRNRKEKKALEGIIAREMAHQEEQARLRGGDKEIVLTKQELDDIQRVKLVPYGTGSLAAPKVITVEDASGAFTPLHGGDASRPPNATANE